MFRKHVVAGLNNRFFSKSNYDSCVCACVYIYVYIYTCVCMCMHKHVYTSTCLDVYLSGHMTIS